MSLSGTLDDFSVQDVLRFIQLGQRTGTLMLAQGGRRVVIGFHGGRLVSARAPGLPRLGELLVSQGLTDPITVRNAARLQAEEVRPRSLGRILVDTGAIEATSLRRIVGRQIQQTLSELLDWRSGSFEFVIGDLRPSDDISFYLGDILPDLDMGSNMILLAAEEGDSPGIAPLEVPYDPPGPDVPAEESLPTYNFLLFDDSELDPDSSSGAAERALAVALPDGAERARVVQILSGDADYAEVLIEEASREGALPISVSARWAGLPVPGTPAPVVLMDLRDAEHPATDLGLLQGRNPAAVILAVVRSQEQAAEAYAAGALAAIPDEAGAIGPCVETVLGQLAPTGDATMPETLQKALSEISINPILDLLQTLTQYVERAVLFQLSGGRLVATGAFGDGSEERPLRDLIKGLVVRRDEPGLLWRAADDLKARTAPYDEDEFPVALTARLGPPSHPHVTVVPIHGERGLLAILYLDNGGLDRPVGDLPLLAAAAAQVGRIYEREFPADDTTASGR